MDKEALYDNHIAPELEVIANKCLSFGISIIAVVEYGKDSKGITQAYDKNHSLDMTMISHCARTVPNIDSYLIGLIRYANENNIDISESLFLSKFNKEKGPD